MVGSRAATGKNNTGTSCANKLRKCSKNNGNTIKGHGSQLDMAPNSQIQVNLSIKIKMMVMDYTMLNKTIL
jgi:hypothetical protein